VRKTLQDFKPTVKPFQFLIQNNNNNFIDNGGQISHSSYLRSIYEQVRQR